MVREGTPLSHHGWNPSSQGGIPAQVSYPSPQVRDRKLGLLSDWVCKNYTSPKDVPLIEKKTQSGTSSLKTICAIPPKSKIQSKVFFIFYF